MDPAKRKKIINTFVPKDFLEKAKKETICASELWIVSISRIQQKIFFFGERILRMLFCKAT